MNDAANHRLIAVLDLRADHGLSTTPTQYNMLRNCAGSNCIRQIYDLAERPAGYVAWAKINKEAVRAMLDYATLPQYAWEWNEGHFILVGDILLGKRFGPPRRHLLNAWFPSARVILYARNMKLIVLMRKGRKFVLAINQTFSSPQSHLAPLRNQPTEPQTIITTIES